MGHLRCWAALGICAFSVACSSGSPPATATPGASSIAYASVVIAPGVQCEDGGIRVDMGVDDNRNGQLDPAEVDASEYVCNGAPGETSLVRVAPEAPGAGCDSGGARIETGLDSDRDGVLDPGEITTSQYVCNGMHLSTPPSLTQLALGAEAAVFAGTLATGDYLFRDGTRADFYTFTTAVSGIADAFVAGAGADKIELYFFDAACRTLPDIADWGGCYVGPASEAHPVPAGSYVLVVKGTSITKAWEAIGYRLGLRVWSNAQGSPSGVPDPAFGVSGTSCLDLPLDRQAPYRVAVQADGRILMLGRVESSFIFPTLTRFGAMGGLDPTFDGDGVVTWSGTVADFALQDDGKVVVGGNLGDRGVALWRFGVDGAPDSGFGVDGVATTTGISGGDVAAIAIAPDGKFAATGGCGGFPDSRTLVARFESRGALDPAFNVSGWTALAGALSFGSAIAFQPDGKVVVGTSTSGTVTRVARFRTDGQLDPTFDGDGVVTIESGYADTVANAAGGDILVAVRNPSRVVRLRADGSVASVVLLDVSSAFPGGPTVRSQLSRIAFAPGERLYAVGYRYPVSTSGARTGPQTAVVARYSAGEGRLDLAFGDRGRVEVSDAAAEDVVVAPDGRVMVALARGAASFGSADESCAFVLK